MDFRHYPPFQGDIWQEFHDLTEYFVKQADYGDKECVRMVFLLHKGTMEENYSLEKLIGECLKKEEPQRKNLRGKNMTPGSTTGSPARRWEALSWKKRKNMWTPVKRFLRRHKKPKWGDWDGLYIEEEEL